MEKECMETHVDKYFFTAFGAVLFGMLGYDRYLRGQVLLGLFKFITLGGLCLWYVIDTIIVLTKVGQYERDFEFINGTWK